MNQVAEPDGVSSINSASGVYPVFVWKTNKSNIYAPSSANANAKLFAEKDWTALEEREREREEARARCQHCQPNYTYSHTYSDTHTGAASREHGKVLLVAVSANVTSRRRHADASATESKDREEEYRWKKEEEIWREKEEKRGGQKTSTIIILEYLRPPCMMLCNPRAGKHTPAWNANINAITHTLHCVGCRMTL